MKGNVKPWNTVRQHRMMAHNRKAFGENIQSAREMKGLSQTKLAELLHIGKSFVCNWESGFSRPDITMIPRICRILDISVQSFYGWPADKSDMDPEEILFLREYMDLEWEDQSLVNAVMRKMLTLEMKAAHDLCRNTFMKIQQYDSEDYYKIRHGNHFRWVRRTEEQKKPDFLVTISGTTLSPLYEDDDDLLGCRCEEIAEGKYGLVLVDEELAVLQRVGDVMTDSRGEDSVPYYDRKRVKIIGEILERLNPGDLPDEKERFVLGNVLRGAG